MKAWFANLEAREQKFVLAAAAFVLFAVLYAGIWMPIDKAQTMAHNGVDTWQRSVDTLRSLKGRIAPGGAGGSGQPSALTQPLVVVISSSLNGRDIGQPQRSQPAGNNIRVEFENVSFDEVVLWLGELSTQYALQVQSGSFTRSASTDPGRVNAQLTLGR